MRGDFNCGVKRMKEGRIRDTSALATENGSPAGGCSMLGEGDGCCPRHRVPVQGANCRQRQRRPGVPYRTVPYRTGGTAAAANLQRGAEEVVLPCGSLSLL